MIKIKVTGIMYVEPEDFDHGPNGPLTEEAYNAVIDHIPLDDVVMEVFDSAELLRGPAVCITHDGLPRQPRTVSVTACPGNHAPSV